MNNAAARRPLTCGIARRQRGSTPRPALQLSRVLVRGPDAPDTKYRSRHTRRDEYLSGRSADQGLLFPAVSATAPALTACYGRRPNQIPDGHIQSGGAE
jgi:hypothetical protein